MTDASMAIEAWNPGAEALFRFNADQVINCDAIELLAAPGTQSATRELTARLTRGGSWSGILSLKRRDRSTFLAHLTATAIQTPDGAIDATLWILHPVDDSERPRRATPAVPKHAAGIELRPADRQALVDGEELDLTATEFDLLELLLTSADRVLSLDDIATAIWGHGTHGSANFVQAAVSRLRRKLRTAGRGHLLETVRGRGYVARLR